MCTQEVNFIVKSSNVGGVNTIDKVQKSIISYPRTNFNGKGIKWFDDSKLLKNK